MTSVAKWNAPSSIVSVLTTELNSISNNAMSAASGAIDNDTNLDMYVDIEVLLAALSPAAGAFIALYILEAPDGTNYPAQSAADLRLTTSQLLCVIPVGTTSSTAQRVVARNILIPPGKFKIVLDNQTGVSLASSGNTVKFLPYNTNLNG
jgi:hypothetical protein